MDVVREELLQGLDAARVRQKRKSSRLKVAVVEMYFPVLEFREGGFALASEDAPKLRGLVDLYAGDNHLYQCLIVASEEDGPLMRYEFKRSTAHMDTPPLDFARDPDAPAGLIEGPR